MHHFMMGSSVGTAVYYCCICKGGKKLHSYNSGDRELETLADLCLQNAPSFHTWYFETHKKRTYGYLMKDSYTYFVIADAGLGNCDILRFLEHVRDGFKKSSKNGFQEELTPVIEKLIVSLEKLPRQNYFEQMPETPSPCEASTSTKAPLLGKSNSNRKKKDRVIDVGDGGENHFDRSGHQETANAFSMQKSPSFTRMQQSARRAWLRQVKIVIAVDVIICVILFAIWMAVCPHFSCVK